MTSLKPNYLPKALSPNTIKFQVRAYEFVVGLVRMEGTVQSIALQKKYPLSKDIEKLTESKRI